MHLCIVFSESFSKLPIKRGTIGIRVHGCAASSGQLNHAAERTGMHYVTERWLGGTLTNFDTVRASIRPNVTAEATNSFTTVSSRRRGDTPYAVASRRITGENDAARSVWLAGAFGLMCGAAGRDAGPARARGLLVVETSRARYEADALRAQVSFDEKQASLSWRMPDDGLRISDVWTLHPPSGVWRRSMRLCNQSDAPVHLRRCLGRFVFAPGRYEVYSQRSGWCDENQGAWRPLDHGAITLGCEGGRTCQGGTPYAVLRDCDSRAAIAFHVMPAGNWRIRVAAVTTGPGADSPPSGRCWTSSGWISRGFSSPGSPPRKGGNGWRWPRSSPSGSGPWGPCGSSRSWRPRSSGPGPSTPRS